VKKTEEYYWKRANVCWIIAGIFFAIGIIGKILLLIATILGH